MLPQIEKFFYLHYKANIVCCENICYADVNFGSNIVVIALPYEIIKVHYLENDLIQHEYLKDSDWIYCFCGLRTEQEMLRIINMKVFI